MVVYKLTLLHHYISPPQVWALSFAAWFAHWTRWGFHKAAPETAIHEGWGFDPAAPETAP